MAARIFRIHPAIGIARVGDAERSGEDFFFIGPEIPGVPANYDPATKTYGQFKKNGKVRPQAARFRIFEYEPQTGGTSKLIGEVKLGARGVKAIKWTVHVANRKASFCGFDGQKGAERPYFKSRTVKEMRNSDVKGLSRRQSELELDPGPKSIDGGATASVELSLSTPKLQKIKTLGQLRSDPEGRLICIGGKGLAEAFPSKKDAELTNYANNDGWFDDVSDGPVSAQLTLDGQPQPQGAEGAWVIIGPPDFSPTTRSYRTMYDTLVDMMVREERSDGPFAMLPPEIEELRRFWKARETAKPSFTKHIYPILSAVAGMARMHGAGGYHGSLDPKFYAPLGNQEHFSSDEVDGIFSRIRDPDAEKLNAGDMPAILGDFPYVKDEGDDPRRLHAVSKLQYALLKAWSAGRVEKDWSGEPSPVMTITPESLDRAALENVTGGPFFPGIEMSWLISKPDVFQAPFRLALGRRIGDLTVPRGAGDTASPERQDVTVRAGTFSQQMALPWHADFRDCRAERFKVNGKFRRMVGWWPVQRPDVAFVLGGANKPVDWDRGMAPGTETNKDPRYRDMVKDWSTRGFVLQVNNNLFEVEGPDAGA